MYVCMHGTISQKVSASSPTNSNTVVHKATKAVFSRALFDSATIDLLLRKCAQKLIKPSTSL